MHEINWINRDENDAPKFFLHLISMINSVLQVIVRVYKTNFYYIY